VCGHSAVRHTAAADLEVTDDAARLGFFIARVANVAFGGAGGEVRQVVGRADRAWHNGRFQGGREIDVLDV
jgi:hypothetical protein